MRLVMVDVDLPALRAGLAELPSSCYPRTPTSQICSKFVSNPEEKDIEAIMMVVAARRALGRYVDYWRPWEVINRRLVEEPLKTAKTAYRNQPP